MRRLENLLHPSYICIHFCTIHMPTLIELYTYVMNKSRHIYILRRQEVLSPSVRTLVNSQGVCSRIRRAAAIMTNIYTNAESVDLLRNSRRIWGDSTLPIVTPLQRKAVGFQSHYVLRKRLLMCSELEDTFRVDWKEVGMTEKLEPKHSLGKISWTRGGKTRLKCETANKDALWIFLVLLTKLDTLMNWHRPPVILKYWFLSQLSHLRILPL